ncbi:hypothetical protein HYPBUDRAFT_153916 [Hyphopichia burtonii NRRL Y-1933]|uniref:XPG-I domain-containing protein n=1 Tax=Hyphopichia burtonii NRRL Y-1933 TaxID=984485 RepID=A0A1E4RES4_9ASCO|nr:hypothetical protein HYPBUDRAFT_153916 [Hyphopichia burtonii NRRL Y-1933]ODV65767.1 hypothetical protein HYPBUDRAFT_153916 [Hyphopichia burtonii NRRL Y-1933]
MAIEGLWNILKDAFGERVSMPVLVSQFIEVHKRTPRLAIDAYDMIFSSSQSGDIESYESYNHILRNFMAKLMYLTSLNVSYIVVFDGCLKPQKLRNNPAESFNGLEGRFSEQYHKEWEEFSKMDRKDYSEGSDLIDIIKLKLQSHKIDYIQSPGEAEAECSILQRTGIVDYVISDDGDCFVFGTTKLLRNFRKSIDDYLEAMAKEYYVTPITLDDIKAKFGLDTHRLVLIAAIGTGDYSKGVAQVGSKRAMKIAQCGTPFAEYHTGSPSKIELKERKRQNKHDQGPLPDFTKLFIKCFYKQTDGGKVFDIWSNIRSFEERRLALISFNSLLNSYIKTRSREIFGRKFETKETLFIIDYFAMVYLFPLVSPSLYKFLPGSLSFGECLAISNDIQVPYDNTILLTQESVPRMNSVYEVPERDIGILELQFMNSSDPESKLKVIFNNFNSYSDDHLLDTDQLGLPDTFDYNVKNIIVKLLSNLKVRTDLKEFVSITRMKSENGIQLLMVKYPKFLKEKVYPKSINEDEPQKSPESKDLMEYTWLPLNLIYLVNKEIVEKFIDNSSAETSLRKKNVPRQKQTLDSFGKFPASPTKRSNKSISSSINLFSSSPLKLNLQASPSKRSLPNSPTRNRKRNSLTLDPNQKPVTSYFTDANPFIDKHDLERNNPLFLSLSDSDTDEDTYQGRKRSTRRLMTDRRVLNRPPPLLQHNSSLEPPSPSKKSPSKRRTTDLSKSFHGSPSKKSRTHPYLSSPDLKLSMQKSSPKSHKSNTSAKDEIIEISDTTLDKSDLDTNNEPSIQEILQDHYVESKAEPTAKADNKVGTDILDKLMDISETSFSD